MVKLLGYFSFYDSGDYVRALEYLCNYYALKNNHIK